MGEKSKWFRPRDRADTPLRVPLQSAASITQADVERFYHEVHLDKPYTAEFPFPKPTYTLFHSLCQMPPASRLSRNLKVVLTILAKRPIKDIFQDGLVREEQLALQDLEHRGAPAEIRAIAQGLLNLQERLQLVQAVRDMYAEERLRHWKDSDDC